MPCLAPDNPIMKGCATQNVKFVPIKRGDITFAQCVMSKFTKAGNVLGYVYGSQGYLRNLDEHNIAFALFDPQGRAIKELAYPEAFLYCATYQQLHNAQLALKEISERGLDPVKDPKHFGTISAAIFLELSEEELDLLEKHRKEIVSILRGMQKGMSSLLGSVMNKLFSGGSKTSDLTFHQTILKSPHCALNYLEDGTFRNPKLSPLIKPIVKTSKDMSRTVNQGLYFYKQKQYPLALRYLLNAMSTWQRLNSGKEQFEIGKLHLPKGPDAIRFLWNIGNTYWRLKDYDNALTYLNRAKDIWEEYSEDPALSKSKSLTEIKERIDKVVFWKKSVAVKMISTPNEIETGVKREIERLTNAKHGSFKDMRGTVNQGLYCYKQKQYHLALRYLLNAMSIWQRLNSGKEQFEIGKLRLPKDPGAISFLWNIGNTYWRLKDYDNALTYLNHAKDIWEKNPGDPTLSKRKSLTEIKERIDTIDQEQRSLKFRQFESSLDDSKKPDWKRDLQQETDLSLNTPKGVPSVFFENGSSKPLKDLVKLVFGDNIAVTINDKRFSSKDSIEDVITELQKLPRLDIDTKAKPQADTSVTILQREDCIINPAKEEIPPDFVATMTLNQCLFIIMTITDHHGKKRYFASHVDDRPEYNWRGQFMEFIGCKISVDIIGGNPKSEESKTNLKKVLKYIINLSEALALDIVFRKQLVLNAFAAKREHLPRLFTDQIQVELAELYKRRLNKPVPQELQALAFGESYKKHVSSIDGFEESLSAYEKCKTIKEKNSLKNRLASYKNKFKSGPEFNFLHLLLVLYHAQHYDKESTTLCSKAAMQLAKKEALLVYRLQQLFSPLGFDAMRYLNTTRNIMSGVFSHDVAYNLHDGCITSIREDFPRGQFEHRRQLREAYNQWHFTSYRSGQGYINPQLDPVIVNHCIHNAEPFIDAARSGIDKNTFDTFMKGLPTDASSISAHNTLCRLMQYIAKHPAEFNDLRKKSTEEVNQNKRNRGKSPTLKRGFLNQQSHDTPVVKKTTGAWLSLGFLNSGEDSKTTGINESVAVKMISKPSEIEAEFNNEMERCKNITRP